RGRGLGEPQGARRRSRSRAGARVARLRALAQARVPGGAEGAGAGSRARPEALRGTLLLRARLSAGGRPRRGGAPLRRRRARAAGETEGSVLYEVGCEYGLVSKVDEAVDCLEKEI